MNAPSEVEIAEEILRKTGFLTHRAALVDTVEAELFAIYSELDSGLPSKRTENPATYQKLVQTVFDLIANRDIHRALYLLQDRGERAFLKKVTHNEDFYVKVIRGKGNDFTQHWYFDFPVQKDASGTGWTGHFKFTLRVGVRDTYPYEFHITDHLPSEIFEDFVHRLRSY